MPTTATVGPQLMYLHGEPKNINEFLRMAIIDRSIVIVKSNNTYITDNTVCTTGTITITSNTTYV